MILFRIEILKQIPDICRRKSRLCRITFKVLQDWVPGHFYSLFIISFFSPFLPWSLPSSHPESMTSFTLNQLKDQCFPWFPFVYAASSSWTSWPLLPAKDHLPTSQDFTKASLLWRKSWSLTLKKIHTSCISGLVFWQSTYNINFFVFINVLLAYINF